MTFPSIWQLGMATAIAIAVGACGQEPAPSAVAIAPDSVSAPQAASAHHPHTTPTASTTPQASSATGQMATADSCLIELGSNDAMQFSLKQIVIPATCQQATIRLTHNGKLPKTAMGHNLVVTSQANLKGVLSDALKAGKEHDFVPPQDNRVLAHSKLLGGGESDSITLDVTKLKTEPHVFVCTFPGHSGPMHGNIVVQ